ncbi:MAG TPA: CSLREA domain-containing protein [Thermoanaerobaculia bacterium]|jgi:CSLREA domain-containing protein|nr:CSLREA domain-containing protein [Thermoanaerobaculia bacterium]
MQRHRLAVLSLAVLFLTVASAAARAAVFAPSKLDDGADGVCDADCSLREAVQAANVRPGEDVIVLRAGIYQLSFSAADDTNAAGDLDVTDGLTILGAGADRTTIDGGGTDRVLQVQQGASLTLRDLTLTHGRAPGSGGAILAFGDLTVERCTLEDNAALGVTEPGQGGAIAIVQTTAPAPRLTIVDSAIVSNDAQRHGGGIYAGSATELRNVTLSGNHALTFGGGIYVTSGAVAELRNTTIAGNSASRGGGLYGEPTAFLGVAPVVTSSIFAGNSGGNSPDCFGDVESGYDLVGNNGDCNGPSAARHDLVGTPGSPLDPRLGPLSNVGGPTPVRALDAGSPAIDAGDPAAPGSTESACPATDQRGAHRPGGPRCDIGAFELTAECVPGGRFLCMVGNRFRVLAHWRTPAGSEGDAEGVQLTPDSGYFWFFGPDNVEVTVKVLDGCGVNNRYWVFSSGVTNVEVTLEVVDTVTGATKTYTNPLNQVFRSILDTGAFPCH